MTATNRRRSMLEQEGRAGEFGSGERNEKELKADLFVIDRYCMFVPLFVYCKCFYELVNFYY